MPQTVLHAPARQAMGLRLHIALLGTPTLVSEHMPVSVARRQARALLYRIAASPHPVSRDQLCFLLWPDIAEAAARRNLSVLLTPLRQALPSPNALVLSGDAIGLCPDRVTVDTAQFAAALQHTPRDQPVARLADVAQLYRGPFLDGFALPAAAEFGAWVDAERQFWERRYLDALTALVEAYAVDHAYHEAIAVAQRALATDELAEEMHRRLIALYAATGDRTAALRQFERCVVVLDRELGVAPLPATRAVYEAVRDGRLGEEAPRQRDSVSPTLLVSSSPASAASASPSPTLPLSLSPLIGREAELAAVRALLSNSTARLLTLCGAGGSGKTRLALEVARDAAGHFANGVVFVPLAPIRDSGLVADAIAAACGLHELRAASALDAVRDYVRDKHLLIVFDNFEHLLGAAPIVASLLAGAPRLHALVTSRTVLHLSGEHTFAVPPLPLPNLAQLPPPEQLAEQPAVALLLARARAYAPAVQLSAANAADLAAICVQLDGLPLAIELAAARLSILSPQALRKRLDHRLALLSHGPRDLPDRQRTLRATIDWSERLLGAPEQLLFARLAVFAGGWSLGAAEAICAINEAPQSILDSLAALLDSHLVFSVSEPRRETRFEMLETIREYALERLRGHADERTIRDQHAAYFRRLVEHWSQRLYGDELLVALDELDRDYNNVRAALQWLHASGQHAALAHLVGALHEYWDTRGLLGENNTWTTQALQMGEALPAPLRATLRSQASFLAARQGQGNEATRLAERVLSDPEAEPADIVRAANVAGLVGMNGGDSASARKHFQYALTVAQQHALLRDVSTVQFNLGLLYLTTGQLTDAETLMEASSEGAQHPRFWGLLSLVRGFIALVRGSVSRERVAKLLREGFQQHAPVRNPFFAVYGLLACGSLVVQQQPAVAVALFSAALHQAGSRELVISPMILALLDGAVERARGALAADGYERAMLHGRSLSLDGALALAQSLLSSMSEGEARNG